MKRRDFIKKATASALLLSPAGLASRLMASSNIRPTTALRLGVLPLLFADDSGIDYFSGVHRTFYPAQTRSRPVLVADRPWEKGRVYIYGSTLYDETSREFRMWYGTPKPSSVLLATSKDGLHWKKPELGIHDFQGSRKNNIVLKDAHSPSLLFDPAAPERYRLISSREHVGYMAYRSPDGLNWTGNDRNPVLQGDDTLTVAQSPATGEYLLYHKRQIPLRGHLRRTTWLSRSWDFQKWTEPQLVFAPDSEDDAWSAKGQRTDVYDMSVIPHAAGYLGFPAMFQVARVRPKSSLVAGQAGDDGPITIQLATSRDGVVWDRPFLRSSMVPLGVKGRFDQGAILGVSNHLLHHKDETWLYYTALNTTHGEAPPIKQLTIGRAAWRLHGFASLDAGYTTGKIRTRLLTLDHPNILINAEASGGSLKVGLVDETNRAIPGFGVDDCIPLRRDLTRWSPQWRSQASPPTDRPIRLVMEMTTTKLFSLSTGVA